MYNIGDKIIINEDNCLHNGEIVNIFYSIKYRDEDKKCSYIIQRTKEELKS